MAGCYFLHFVLAVAVEGCPFNGVGVAIIGPVKECGVVFVGHPKCTALMRLRQTYD
jgi:hypothetical protein